ncbi:MAG: type II toxin-antitoxin system VapC family toxin [Planctomycetes bacterium]|nr:type II toxin-antitoxin system VapC family toxin [Planctomycetota bacterium]
MNAVLLDTSAYSAFRRGLAPAVHVLRTVAEIAVTPVVLGELLAGFRLGKHRSENEEELSSFLDSPRVRIVPVDETTADRYAAILAALRRAGTPIPTNDMWIAASAMQHGLVVLTSDAHFERVPQVLVRLLPST